MTEERQYTHVYERIKLATWFPFLFTLLWILDFAIIPPIEFRESVVDKEIYNTYSRGGRARTNYATHTQWFTLKGFGNYQHYNIGDSVFLLASPIFRDIKQIHSRSHRYDINYRQYIEENIDHTFVKFGWAVLVLGALAIFVCKPGINSATFTVFTFVFFILILIFIFM